MGFPEAVILLACFAAQVALTPASNESDAAEPGVEEEEEQRPEDEAKEEQGSPGETPAIEKAPPVYLVPGNGTLTILSDDPQALDDLEGLITSLAPQATMAGRNMSIFELQYASASEVADELEEMFQPSRDSRYSRYSRYSPYGYRSSMSTLKILADPRRNTIIVQGSRMERETVAELIKVLDSAELPEALADHQPKMVPILNTDAERVFDVIEDVFRSQLGVRSSSSSSSRSRGILAPRVTVDETTNSLVIKAAPPLLDEIVRLAETLDEAAAQNSSRQLKIISLKKTNAKAIEEALDRISGRSRSRYYRSSR
jgi:type II secretory pathway component GspD/PulD (secretin)